MHAETTTGRPETTPMNDLASPSHAAQWRRAPAAAGARTKRILLVDDSSTSHMWVRMILNKTPYEMISARDGAEGVTVAGETRPDLILMDVVMPNMDGFEATRRLRGVPATESTPIIMLTTRGEAKNLETGYASGCSDYVTKPIDSLELLSKIRSFLGE
ncbi:MAG TPA: response regulator [Longimicrobiaceae bacterium]|nr:response regulator [Longimicrobiaceae bacterium]